MNDMIDRLQGPVLVLGASGFIGANLFRHILARRQDVVGTYMHEPAWRLEGIPDPNVMKADLLVSANIGSVLERVQPRTIFNCIAYGAYSFEVDADLIYQTNFLVTARLLEALKSRELAVYVHAGSSSEYGDQAASPPETAFPEPNSAYAVSKVACANLIRYMGKKKQLPCVNLRLYSVYGPLEDASRLMPVVVKRGRSGCYPDWVNAEVSRDFVYIDDVCEAFLCAALSLRLEDYGESFNIGSGQRTTIGELARLTHDVFGIKDSPVFGSMPNREWDMADWYANPEKARRRLGWECRTGLPEGLRRMAAWYDELEDKETYESSSKKFAMDARHGVSVIIACYKDGQAIPVMYQRLKAILEKLRIDYEIIFVNDSSPDNSEEVILDLSRKDPRVLGISHSRNFGSQAAFRSGMEISSKNACVIMDGDLQDPPELIEQFVQKWREGNDVVYGRRVKRDAPLHMQLAYKLFYRIFDAFSYVHIPRDAGDFSLMDKQVVRCMLRFPERDLFLRGVRAFVGFKQAGVDYVRPERLFGVTTNSLARNIGWAKKGILSFSYVPLNVLSAAGSILLLLSTLLGTLQILSRLFFPSHSPRGITTVLLIVLFFGSLNLFAVSVIGEYMAKVFEEVKRRPLFIRRLILRNGEAREVSDALQTQRGRG